MGVKVNMNEVKNMKNAIKSELDKTNGDVDTLKESMASLINTEQFKGATATSVKSYTRTFHYQSINKIKNTNKDYVADMDKSISKFSNQVDNDEAAILHEDKIKTYKDDISKKVKSMKETIEYVNNWIDTVDTLTTAQKVKNEDLTSKATTFKDHVDDTIDKLVNFDAVNSTDGDLTNNLLTELKGLTTYVKNDLPANRSTISGTSGKIEHAILMHKVRIQIEKWQKFLELNGNLMNILPPYVRQSMEVFNSIIKEYLVLKAIGLGDVRKGFNIFKNSKDVNKLIDSLTDEQVRKISLSLNTNLDNVKLKNILKNVKNNSFEKGDFIDWISKIQEYNDKSTELLKKELKSNGFPFKYEGNHKFFDSNKMKKAVAEELKNTFVSENLRKHIFNKENIKSYKKLKENVDGYISTASNEFKRDFKSKNVLGKLGHLSKIGGRVLKPLEVATIISDNMDGKTGQEKAVGMGVDFGAMATAGAVGAAVGSIAFPVPFVGAAAGAVAAIGISMMLDAKLPGKNKSIKTLAKEGINKFIDTAKRVDRTTKFDNREIPQTFVT
ncbi:LXG domain-containing protein [Staphylococcus agnetis]|uniref:LXG domain-containing protein n=1 Tax=Staphylococcus agnetis TaxID=985762 RepID=A0ABD7TWD0_9STAP|nr:LXG domain-containing protein [Staphylococcus agnetis]UXU57152.1 LXG domain-containing protein [Staphylococcus agnetis]